MTDDLADRQRLFEVYAESPTLLHLAGELDVVGAPAVAQALEPLTARGGIIELDVSKLTFMDSTGINALLRAVHDLDGRGRIVLLNATPSVRRIIQIAGLVGIIDIDDDPHR